MKRWNLTPNLFVLACTCALSVGTANLASAQKGNEHIRRNLNPAEQAADNQIKKDAVKKQFGAIDVKFEAPVMAVLDCAEQIDAADFQVLAKKLSHSSAGEALAGAVRQIRQSATQVSSVNHVVDYAVLQREEQETTEGYFRMFVLSNATKVVAILNCMETKR